MTRTRVGGVAGSGTWAYLSLSLIEGRGRPALESFSIPADKPLVIVRKSEEDLEDTSDAAAALSALFPDAQVSASGQRRGEQPGASPDMSEIVRNAAFFGADERTRWASLERLARGSRLVFATAESLSWHIPSRREFRASRRTLRMGDTIPMSRIIHELVELGYQRVDFVGSPGEFAVRGAVVDVFPLEPLRTVRLLFNESLIESIRTFDPETQAGGEFLDELVLAPIGISSGAPIASDAAGKSTLTQWLTDGFCLIEDGIDIPFGAGQENEFSWAVIGAFAGQDALDFGAKSSVRFQGNLDLAIRQFQKWRQEGYEILIYSLNRGESERVQELLRGKFEAAAPSRIPVEDEHFGASFVGACRFLIGPLRSGFILSDPKRVVVASSELFGRSYRPAPKWFRYETGSRRRLRPADLKPGDYVVHQQYGIARYLGIRVVEVQQDGEMDCLLLEYRSSDKLYVPMADFGLVQKFIAAEGHRPRLSSLDTRSWEDIKERVKEGVRELAEGLLKIQAARAARPGHAFAQDSHMEVEFAESFPYEETPDQHRAIAEVKADMMAATPMDRLVVGDVGFGKTEVAMRAALKCVSGGKQTAVLVPTTILAAQHSRTFSQRFAEYPVKVAMLSRFQTPAEQKRIVEGLHAGTIDIVVGTHRLLSPDIRFHDLGLLIIDEEHRFGVKHKEKLKALKSDVDVLSLSATPIPRTLNQSLSGLRGISIIESAPSGRQPITTWVGPWSPVRIVAAIEAELARGGQAYYVDNHVRGLPKKVKELGSLLPGVRFSMVHGQMRSDAVEKSMWDFYNRQSDVLVASTIIESGLDIPTVNTLLVEDAQNFGLAQLYQLRGRIGRERQKAYCYLFCPEGTDEIVSLPEEARRRLEALREFSELGSGLRLAMRDLEIRGAGDLLGARQHGFINAVGVEYYSQLLNDQIAELKGQVRPAQTPPAQLDLAIQAFIPENYLPGESERLEFYKRLLAADKKNLSKLRGELEDLSGPAPESVSRLFRLLEIRLQATEAGIREVAQRGEIIEIRFRPDAQISPPVIQGWIERWGSKVGFTRSPDGDGVRLPMDEADPLDWLERFVYNSTKLGEGMQ